MSTQHEARFSDRAARSKEADREREYKRYRKRAQSVTVETDGVPTRFHGCVDRWNRGELFRSQMSDSGFALDHIKEMDCVGSESPDDRKQRKKPGSRTWEQREWAGHTWDKVPEDAPKLAKHEDRRTD